MSLIDRVSAKHSAVPMPAKPAAVAAAPKTKFVPKKKRAAAEMEEQFADDALLDTAADALEPADALTSTDVADVDSAAAADDAAFDDFAAEFKSAGKNIDAESKTLDAGASSAGPSSSAASTGAPRTPGSKRQSREFELDYDRLNKFGFITPKMRRSRISEEFRLIKRRLMQRMSLSRGKSKRQRGREHVIIVTSARPSEGKSFVAVNLALSIILDEGLNVMLVDGDVARPSISKIFGLRNDLPGLTDLLLGDADNLHDVLLREQKLPLSLLAAGAVVPSATDLFSSDEMHSLVTDMASRYSDRIIIFDAPPLLASTEPVALAEHAGQIVLTIDAQRTTSGAVDSALDLLESDQNVNLVLNKTSVGNRTEQFGSYYEAYNQIAS